MKIVNIFNFETWQLSETNKTKTIAGVTYDKKRKANYLNQSSEDANHGQMTDSILQSQLVSSTKVLGQGCLVVYSAIH